MVKIVFDVTQTSVVKILQQENATSGSINNIQCEFNLSEEYKDLNCVAVFNCVHVPIVENMCYAPELEEGKCTIGVVGYSMENDEYTLRISPVPAIVYVSRGSVTEISEDETPSPSEFEKYLQTINELVNSGKLKGEKGDKGDKGTDGRDGSDGKNGQDGYTPQKGIDYFDGKDGVDGSPFTYEDFTPEQLASLKGEKGDKGDNYNLTEADKAEIAEQVNIPVKNIKIDNDSIVSEDGTAEIPYASASKAGILKVPNGCGISVDSQGNALVNFPINEIESSDDSVEVTHGSGSWNIKVNQNKFIDKNTFDSALSDKADADDIPNLDNYEKVNELELQVDTKTYLTNLADGMYLVTQRGSFRISPDNDIGATVNKGARIRVFTTYSGSGAATKNCILYTSSNLYIFNENSTNVISEKLIKNSELKTIGGESLIGSGDISIGNQCILVADTTLSEECAEVAFTTDLDGQAFSYQKVLLEVTLPEVISATVHPYIQIGNNGTGFNNLFGYMKTGFKNLNAMIERLPNGHFKCDVAFQANDYYANESCSVINKDTYMIRNTDINTIRFLFRQDTVGIPSGTNIKLWGFK